MYYITNQNNQIIAVDPSLLALLQVEDIDALYREIALRNTSFSLSADDQKVTIATAQDEETYNVEKHHLSSMLGDITLVQLQTSYEPSITIDNGTVIDDDTLIEDFLTKKTVEEDETAPIETPEADEISIMDDFLKEPADIEPEKDEIENEELLFDDLLSTETPEADEISIMDDLLDELDDTELEKPEKDKIENNDELFELVMPTSPEESIDTISIIEEDEQIETVEDTQAPIVIDVEDISQSIGISTEDYNTFLNEYIDTALSLEEDLQSTQEGKRSRAIDTLSHLSNVLHLPVVSQTIIEMKNATSDTQRKYIESFYAMLARLTTAQPNMHEEEPLLVPEKEPVTTPIESFGTISLDDVKPKHFDFQLEQAATELSLPTELIKEFVIDFIAQAHTETKKMLEAYEKGDLDAIQKIGHLLKGASSNLRIKALSDTLYEIQFCEDSSKLEDLIRNYWAHFLSLEMQIDLTTK